MRKRNRGGGGSVHVRAGITQFNKTNLVISNGNVNARRYIDDVLRPVALPFLGQNYRRGNFIYQLDNAQLIVPTLQSICWQQIGFQC